MSATNQRTVDGEPIEEPDDDDSGGGLGTVVVLGIFAGLAALLGAGNDENR